MVVKFVNGMCAPVMLTNFLYKRETRHGQMPVTPYLVSHIDNSRSIVLAANNFARAGFPTITSTSDKWGSEHEDYWAPPGYKKKVEKPKKPEPPKPPSEAEIVKFDALQDSLIKSISVLKEMGPPPTGFDENAISLLRTYFSKYNVEFAMARRTMEIIRRGISSDGRLMGPPMEGKGKGWFELKGPLKIVAIKPIELGREKDDKMYQEYDNSSDENILRLMRNLVYGDWERNAGVNPVGPIPDIVRKKMCDLVETQVDYQVYYSINVREERLKQQRIKFLVEIEEYGADVKQKNKLMSRSSKEEKLERAVRAKLTKQTGMVCMQLEKYPGATKIVGRYTEDKIVHYKEYLSMLRIVEDALPDKYKMMEEQRYPWGVFRLPSMLKPWDATFKQITTNEEKKLLEKTLFGIKPGAVVTPADKLTTLGIDALDLKARQRNPYYVRLSGSYCRRPNDDIYDIHQPAPDHDFPEIWEVMEIQPWVDSDSESWASDGDSEDSEVRERGPPPYRNTWEEYRQAERERVSRERDERNLRGMTWHEAEAEKEGRTMEEYWYHHKDDIVHEGDQWYSIEDYWGADDDDGAAGSAVARTDQTWKERQERWQELIALSRERERERERELSLTLAHVRERDHAGRNT